jgi:hypothetical protein
MWNLWRDNLNYDFFDWQSIWKGKGRPDPKKEWYEHPLFFVSPHNTSALSCLVKSVESVTIGYLVF